MLSSDKNVENIAQLVEIVKHYLGLQGEYLKLDVVDKLVSLIKAIALVVVFFIIFMAIAFYVSFAIAFWLAGFIGYTAAFFIVAVFFILLFLLLIVLRKPLIERPLVQFLANLFLGK